MSVETDNWPICQACSGTGRIKYPEGYGICLQCNAIGRVNPCFVNKTEEEFKRNPLRDLKRW
jgi:hypothetical protein